MKAAETRKLLHGSLNGSEIRTGARFDTLRKGVPQAWTFWKTTDAEWAAFVVSSERFSGVDLAGIDATKNLRLRPVLVLSDVALARTVSPHYRALATYVACSIAGVPHLIPPVIVPPQSGQPSKSPTRVPLDVLGRLARDNNLPGALRNSIRALVRTYKSIGGGTNADNAEKDALMVFARKTLDEIGLDATKLDAAGMLHTLESARVLASRDHFFHSFQNYFLGLVAVSRLREYFEEYNSIASLNWQVNPYDVWFLTALWHDLGYLLQKSSSYFDRAIGYDEQAQKDAKAYMISKFLEGTNAQEAVRYLGSLLARLLHPKLYNTGWIPPRPTGKLGSNADGIIAALRQNVERSHGATSAIRLYCDFCEDLDKLDPGDGVQERLRQTVLLASCSMPFHDPNFRSDVRANCSACKIGTRALPFAALLAFIDSIQDDRRNIEGIEEAVLVLEELVFEDPATISAKINPHALRDDTLLDKIIECRDVLASLMQTQKALYFKYPDWICV